MNTTIYDVIIIGAGPAGLSASIYASRYRLKNAVFGKLVGGAIALSDSIENYPGFTSVKGIDLAIKMKEQVEGLGADLIAEHITEISKTDEDFFTVKTDTGRTIKGRGIILAAGSERRKLEVPGEAEYLGRGVSYCATCDGMFFRHKTVAVVGGGDSALTSALLLTDIASKVYLIYRKNKDNLRAEPIWIDRFEEAVKSQKAEFIFNTSVTEVVGDGNRVTGVNLTGRDTILLIDGIFVEIGSYPLVTLAQQLGVKTDEQGYIVINAKGETSIAGVYAAGDITTGSNRFDQIVTAVAEGAIAVAALYQNLKRK